MTKSLADKAVSIKWKSYVQVKDRIQYLADNYEWRYSMQSEYQYFPERKMWVVRATLTIWDEEHKEFSIYNWLAQEVESDSYKDVNFSSALENCETSAWWRACASAWIGIDATGGIASANEMQKALNRSKAVEQEKSNELFADAPSNPEPEWFEKAKQNIKFMQQCLDENDYIAKTKARVNEVGAKMTKQQETDLRICYANAIAMKNMENVLPLD